MSPRPVDASLAGPERERPNGPTPLIDAAAAGALLGVPASWVATEARADRIPHVRLGRYVRFDADELEVWWQSRRRGPWRDRGEAAKAARTGAHPVSRQSGGAL